MKAILLAVVGCVVIGGGYAAYHYSGARVEVGKKRVLQEIDSWLGESDVRRTEIDRGIRGMDEAIAKLSDARIKAQVQSDMLGKELAGNRKKIEESKTSLVKLKTDLVEFDSNSDFKVVYGAKTYAKKDDLNKMAAKVIEYHKALIAQTETMEKRFEAYELTAVTLLKNETEAKKKVADMKNSLKELDAKIELVKAQRAAADALNESDKSFAGSIAGIEDKIKSLDAGTETAVRKEAEKWKEISAKTEVEDATKIINNSKNTVGEIDELLGK